MCEYAYTYVYEIHAVRAAQDHILFVLSHWRSCPCPIPCWQVAGAQGIWPPPCTRPSPPGGIPPTPPPLPPTDCQSRRRGIKLGLVENKFFSLNSPSFFFFSFESHYCPPTGFPTEPVLRPSPPPAAVVTQGQAGGGPALCPCLTSGIACSGQGGEGVAAVRDHSRAMWK